MMANASVRQGGGGGQQEQCEKLGALRKENTSYLTLPKNMPKGFVCLFVGLF